MLLVTVRYHEIALKGANRPRFIARLADNLRRATSDLGLRRIRRSGGRLLLEFDAPIGSDAAWAAVRTRIGWVFGVANFSPTVSVERDLRALGAAAVGAAAEHSFESFRIGCKRADKTFPGTSPEICRDIGAQVQAATGAAVDLMAPDLTIEIEILRDQGLVSSQKLPGPGGLPVGISGHVVALLSGGIDSPVAAARLMRRGCRVTFVHFHSAPYLDRSSQDKARELAALLTRHQ
jgi:thiamine biosynthesis protein ThiI